MAIEIQLLPFEKIALILAPTTSLTCQQLADAVKEAESQLWMMSYLQVVNLTGKKPIPGGAEAVSISFVYGWKPKFEDRVSFTRCYVTQGNIVSFTDFEKTMDPDTFEESDNCFVQFSQSAAPAAIGLEGVEADIETVHQRVLEMREKNIRRFMVRATVADPARNVNIGDWDYEEVVIKADSASDFASPISVAQRKVAYEKPTHDVDGPFYYINAD